MGAGAFWEVKSIMEIKTMRSIQMIVQIINEVYIFIIFLNSLPLEKDV